MNISKIDEIFECCISNDELKQINLLNLSLKDYSSMFEKDSEKLESTDEIISNIKKNLDILTSKQKHLCSLLNNYSTEIREYISSDRLTKIILKNSLQKRDKNLNIVLSKKHEGDLILPKLNIIIELKRLSTGKQLKDYFKLILQKYQDSKCLILLLYKGESEDSDIRIGDAITGYYAMELLNYSIIIYYIPKISSKEEYRWDKYKDNDTIISNINQLTEKIINKVKVM